MPHTPFIPKLDKLIPALASDFGISAAMLGTSVPIPNINDPGLPNYVKTIIETTAVSIQPILSVVQAVGSILTALQSLASGNPTEIIEIFAEQVLTPIADLLAVIANFLPPTVDSFSSLILTPITQNLKLPDFYFPSTSFAPLTIFPEIVLPIPAFGAPTLPPFPTIEGQSIPPNIKMLLSIISVPLDMIMKVFEPVKLLMESLTDPTQIPDAISSLLNLPNDLLPSIENIVAQIKAKMGIPDSTVITSFIEKIGLSFFKIIGWILGFEVDEILQQP